MSIVDRLRAAVAQLRGRGTRQCADNASLDANGNDYDETDADEYDANRGLDSSRFFDTFGEG